MISTIISFLFGVFLVILTLCGMAFLCASFGMAGIIISFFGLFLIDSICHEFIL